MAARLIVDAHRSNVAAAWTLVQRVSVMWLANGVPESIVGVDPGGGGPIRAARPKMGT